MSDESRALQPEGVLFSTDQSFAVVGAGRVGLSIGVLLQRAGVKIVGASVLSSSSLERASLYLNCPTATDFREVIPGADRILIAVPDDALTPVAAAIAAEGVAPGTIVVHAAGSLGLEPLAPLAAAGAKVAAIHVLQSVPDVELGIERIPGSWFGVTCDDDLRAWSQGFVEALGGRIYWVADDDRTRYHAAAVFASNYLVALALLIEEMGGAVEPYLPLMEGTLRNIATLGPAAALTGPVVRGDVGTIARHLDLLTKAAPAVEQAYRVLAGAALRAGVRGERLSAEAAKRIDALIGGTK